MEEKKLEQNEIEAMENSEVAAAEEGFVEQSECEDASKYVEAGQKITAELNKDNVLSLEQMVDRQAEAIETVEESSDVAADQTEAVEEKEQDPPEEATEAPAEKTEAVQNDVPAEDLKEKACEKLRDEQKKADNKQFAEPVINYLLKRCEEDNGLAQDVMQEHKTWKKCFEYIYGQARKQAKGNTAAVRDDVVYEWAEDYYHKDDKAEEEKKAKEAAERKKKAEENKKKAAEKKKTTKKSVEKKEEKEAPKPAETKPKKNPKDMDGQMDLFSLMGM